MPTRPVSWHHLADETATDAQTYLNALTEVAAGPSPDTAIPVLLLAVSQILLGGARLGAITDVVPSERFEPDAGPDPDIDPLRTGLANLLEGLDEYADIVDPLTSGELIRGILSDDLADVAADLAHGLRHYRDGRVGRGAVVVAVLLPVHSGGCGPPARCVCCSRCSGTCGSMWTPTPWPMRSSRP